MFGMGYAGPDPALLGVFVGTGGFQNSMSYSNPEVDALLDEAVKVPGHEDRAEIYSEIQQILLDDMPRLPLFDRKVPFPVAETCHDFWTDDSKAGLEQAERSYWKVWCSN
jgi:ABC-type transport system substrate-binding protein